MAAHNDLGKWGEDYAADYLVREGYDIIERDWRLGGKDIDIVARTPDGTTVVFVEVKTRRSDAITKPADAVNRQKMRNLGHAANAYVKMHQLWDELRFDVITIVGCDEETVRMEHIKDAFNPLLL
ncbi:TIGR00252 family protein [Prevotella sp. DNF00663]|uniref:YraN family protein n=1 Tax=Prevotella sp. DNF00663 TaxID=1384078 RepID=UPI000784A319|nr:YraN family protein [Prevotella sp. DNF00663]KXB83386.1 TIGR00252 family protein [Prevotella sp. DNF00663]